MHRKCNVQRLQPQGHGITLHFVVQAVLIIYTISKYSCITSWSLHTCCQSRQGLSSPSLWHITRWKVPAGSVPHRGAAAQRGRSTALSFPVCTDVQLEELHTQRSPFVACLLLCQLRLGGSWGALSAPLLGVDMCDVCPPSCTGVVSPSSAATSTSRSCLNALSCAAARLHAWLNF